ncbi:hypothetical protein GCM10007094_23160 [Pseudovibrio japonicus]|uniref:Uncharacterized protein n=1 Tax=Pseudovibrio japonicus TaxID=366534 RepID=A0ABQ3ECM6_9HYPH|nr:hypothetical protein [Pseudovibrio japonicus]GHB33711.1 hypothetical protein GCM10007094_23160 [Pseudovibrio japonicus]
MLKLTPEAEARAAQFKIWHEEQMARFANLNNSDLAASTRLYMANMDPIRFAPGAPVYEATMWHVIIPELLRRLEEKGGE